MKQAAKTALMDSKLKCVFIDEPESHDLTTNGEVTLTHTCARRDKGTIHILCYMHVLSVVCHV